MPRRDNQRLDRCIRICTIKKIVSGSGSTSDSRLRKIHARFSAQLYVCVFVCCVFLCAAVFANCMCGMNRGSTRCICACCERLLCYIMLAIYVRMCLWIVFEYGSSLRIYTMLSSRNYLTTEIKCSNEWTETMNSFNFECDLRECSGSRANSHLHVTVIGRLFADHFA